MRPSPTEPPPGLQQSHPWKYNARMYGPRSEQDCSLGGRASQNGATLELPLKAHYLNDVPFVALPSSTEIGQVAALPQSPTCFATALVPDQSQRAGPPVGLGWRYRRVDRGILPRPPPEQAVHLLRSAPAAPSSGLRPFLNEPSLIGPPQYHHSPPCRKGNPEP